MTQSAFYLLHIAVLLALVLHPLAGSATIVPYYFTGSGTASLDGGPAVSGPLTLIGVGDPLAGGGGSPTLGVIVKYPNAMTGFTRFTRLLQDERQNFNDSSPL